jgi:hypothetical protein
MEDVPSSTVKNVDETISLCVAVICKVYKALCYKQEGRGFETQLGDLFFLFN